mmetsp:Transcript_19936/g.22260  ORF Transcript_19936/g.22260 Transcript_19936/m.22260 type:complete len:583 (-) Transcript_19936:137-1885(-)
MTKTLLSITIIILYYSTSTLEIIFAHGALLRGGERIINNRKRNSSRRRIRRLSSNNNSLYNNDRRESIMNMEKVKQNSGISFDFSVLANYQKPIQVAVVEERPILQEQSTPVVVEEDQNDYDENDDDIHEDDQGYDPIVGVRPHQNLLPYLKVNASLYAPGEFTGNLKSNDGALRLSNGLKATLIAQSGEHIELYNGTKLNSSSLFLSQPNGGAVFLNEDGGGGWSYLINSRSYLSTENEWFSGGVGALDFNSDGNLIGYRRILSGTSFNNGGGKTPWNSWITCEEWTCRQVDPMLDYYNNSSNTTNNPVAIPTLGLHKELSSFAYYNRTTTATTMRSNGNSVNNIMSSISSSSSSSNAMVETAIIDDDHYPWFFISRNDVDGVVTRFIPNDEGQRCYDSDDKWCTLQYLNHDYLVLNPANGTFQSNNGTFEWSLNLTAASSSAYQDFQHVDHLSVDDGMLYMISKPLGRVISLNLETGTYQIQTKIKDFLAEQDHFLHSPNEVLLFPDDQGGISGRFDHEEYFVLLYPETLPSTSNVTGVLSPDGKHLYVAYQETGQIYDVERVDGQSLDGILLELTRSML